MIQILTGFNNLGHHSFNKGEINSDNCRLCQEDETEEIWHLVSDCLAVQTHWLEIFGPSGPIPGKWKIKDIEKFFGIREVEYIMKNRQTNV